MAKKTKGIIQAYTDGSYNNQAGVGGYGAVIFMNKRLKKYSSHVSYVDTNVHRMEIRAILAVLRRVEPGYTIDIYSDSTYCVNTLNNIKSSPWYKPGKHKDLWNKIKEQINDHINNDSKLAFSWVRGHAGNPFNEMADKLAQAGAVREKKVVCDQSKTASNG
jgi:ribonuclease HI